MRGVSREDDDKEVALPDYAVMRRNPDHNN